MNLDEIIKSIGDLNHDYHVKRIISKEFYQKHIEKMRSKIREVERKNNRDSYKAAKTVARK